MCLCALVKRAVHSRGRSASLAAALCATLHFIPSVRSLDGTLHLFYNTSRNLYNADPRMNALEKKNVQDGIAVVLKRSHK